MKMMIDLFSTDYGIQSLIVIGLIVVVMGVGAAKFMKMINSSGE